MVGENDKMGPCSVRRLDQQMFQRSRVKKNTLCVDKLDPGVVEVARYQRHVWSKVSGREYQWPSKYCLCILTSEV